MKSLRPKPVLFALALGTLLTSIPRGAEARDKDDCQQAWSRAVRSYLTQNRKAGPDGKIAKTMDELELSAQAWANMFGPACDLEAEGRKADARIEAAMLGVQVLSKLDPRGCIRFMDSYMESRKAEDICSMGQTGSTADLRAKIKSSIPEKK